jgi:hypothetical protein
MKYVTKIIAEIAISKGFDRFTCTCGGFPTCICPIEDSVEYQQLIEWIFNEDVIDEYIVLNAAMNSQVEWLEFWYNTLMPELCPTCGGCQSECSIIDIKEPDCYQCNFRDNANEFVLEGFIGMLINWFEKNNYELSYYNHNWHIITTKGIIEVKSELYKQQTRYEGIKQVFKLMKGE